jgi:hypothetical protein
MTPFEMLYGHRCQTPLFWSEVGEHKVFVPDILQETEKQVRMVRENRAILIIGDETQALKLEILCTSRCHL